MLTPFVSFFNEVDTRPRPILMALVSFLTSWTQDNELFSYPLFHFFKRGLYRNELSSHIVSFFNEVDTRQRTILINLIMDHMRTWLPRGLQ